MIVKAKDKLVENKTALLVHIVTNYRRSPTYSVRDSKNLKVDQHLVLPAHSNCHNYPSCHWETPVIKFKQAALTLNQLIMPIKP